MHTAAEITANFAEAQLEASPAEIELLAAQLAAAHGDLDALVSGLWASSLPSSQSGLTVALAYKSALRRLAEPAYFAQGLRTEAAALDERADDLIAEAAQDHLVVQVRRDRWGPEDETAANVEARATASKALAADLSAQASDKRIAANRIERNARRQNMDGVVISAPRSAFRYVDAIDGRAA